MKKEYDVTLIYNSSHAKRANQLAKVLSDAGLAVWFDGDQVVPGANWAAAMDKAISSSRYIMVLIGSGSYGPWVQHEYSPSMHASRDRDFLLVPVLLPGASRENVPSVLSMYNFYDLSDWSSDRLQQLALLLLRSNSAGTGTNPKPKIFLCHAKEDAKRAEELYGALRLEGFEPWFDKAKLNVGDNWRDEIEEAIEVTDFFAILLSKTAVEKTGFIHRELNLAIRQFQLRPQGMAFLIPIRLEEFKIPRFRVSEITTLNELHWIDVFIGEPSSVKALANGLWKQWNKRSAQC